MKALTFLFFTFLVSFSTTLSALHGNLILSKAENIQDQWRGILPGRPPIIPTCTQVVRLEPFSANVFFANPALKDGKFHVSGKLKMLNPAGEVAFETSLKPQQFACENPKSVFLFSDYAYVSFDPPDKEGIYTFIAELKDENDESTFTAKATINLKNERSLPPSDDPFAVMSRYYQEPAPQNILPAFDDFLKKIPELKKKQGENFNPMSALAIFFYALKSNPQLHADFARKVETFANSENKFYGATIMHELGEKAFALLSKDLQKHWNPNLKEIFTVKKVKASWQLDVLWSEFLAQLPRVKKS